MKDLLVLLAHLLTTIAKLLGPSGARAVVADSLLKKQQLLVINPSQRRAPNLSTRNRLLFGSWSWFLNKRRIKRAAEIIRQPGKSPPTSKLAALPADGARESQQFELRPVASNLEHDREQRLRINHHRRAVRSVVQVELDAIQTYRGYE